MLAKLLLKCSLHNWQWRNEYSAQDSTNSSCLLGTQAYLCLWFAQGLKLQYGHVPLYIRGDDANARQFTSLHGVQRHMVDANKCKMVFDDNEEEYVEFYDWSKLEDELAGTGLQHHMCTIAVTLRLCLSFVAN